MATHIHGSRRLTTKSAHAYDSMTVNKLSDVVDRSDDTWWMSEADLPEFNRSQLRAIEVIRGGGLSS